MDADPFERMLRAEGFRRVYVWEDGPHTVYPDHAHPVETAHVVLAGELTLTTGGTTRTYRAGERPPDVPAHAIHSARIGAEGCRYLIGER